MARAGADPLDGVRSGPLALAALAYWRAGSSAALGLRVGLRLNAVTGLTALADIGEGGHPGIRGRALDRAAALLAVLTAPAEPRP